MNREDKIVMRIALVVLLLCAAALLYLSPEECWHIKADQDIPLICR